MSHPVTTFPPFPVCVCLCVHTCVKLLNRAVYTLLKVLSKPQVTRSFRKRHWAPPGRFSSGSGHLDTKVPAERQWAAAPMGQTPNPEGRHCLPCGNRILKTTCDLVALLQGGTSVSPSADSHVLAFILKFSPERKQLFLHLFG